MLPWNPISTYIAFGKLPAHLLLRSFLPLTLHSWVNPRSLIHCAHPKKLEHGTLRSWYAFILAFSSTSHTAKLTHFHTLSSQTYGTLLEQIFSDFWIIILILMNDDIHPVLSRPASPFWGLVLVYYYTSICDVTVTTLNLQIGLVLPVKSADQEKTECTYVHTMYTTT